MCGGLDDSVNVCFCFKDDGQLDWLSVPARLIEKFQCENGTQKPRKILHQALQSVCLAHLKEIKRIGVFIECASFGSYMQVLECGPRPSDLTGTHIKWTDEKHALLGKVGVVLSYQTGTYTICFGEPHYCVLKFDQRWVKPFDMSVKMPVRWTEKLLATRHCVEQAQEDLSGQNSDPLRDDLFELLQQIEQLSGTCCQLKNQVEDFCRQHGATPELSSTVASKTAQ